MMDFRILSGQQVHVENENALQRIQKARDRFILQTAKCSLLPLFQMEIGLEFCLQKECVFQQLLDDVYICPKHFSLHRCNLFMKQCLIAWNGREHFCRISCKDLHDDEYVDGIDMPFSSDKPEYASRPSTVFFSSCAGQYRQKKSMSDEVYTRMYRHLKFTISNIVVNMSSLKCRRTYNKAMSKYGKRKEMQVGERDIASEILVSRDIYSLAKIILQGNNNRKANIFLLKNAHAFVYFLFQKYTQGLCHNSSILIKPPSYILSFCPLPSKKNAEKHFDLHLTKLSKCVLVVQAVFEKINVFNAFTERNKRIKQ